MPPAARGTAIRSPLHRRLATGALGTTLAFTVATATLLSSAAPTASAAGGGADDAGRTVLGGHTQVNVSLTPDDKLDLDLWQLGTWDNATSVDLIAEGAPARHDLSAATVHISCRTRWQVPAQQDWRVIAPAGQEVCATAPGAQLDGEPLGINRQVSAASLSTSRNNAPDGNRYRHVVLNIVGATAPGRAMMFRGNNDLPSQDAAFAPNFGLSSIDPAIGTADDSPHQWVSATPWTFNNDGVYCLDLQAHAWAPGSTSAANRRELLSDVETLRVVVGDWDMWSDQPCGTGPDLPEGYYPGQVDPLDQSGNRLLIPTHTDVAPYWNDAGEWSAGFHQTASGLDAWRNPANTVVFVTDTAKLTMPEDVQTSGASLVDNSFITAPGQTFWRLPQSQTPAGNVFLGYSGESFAASDFQGRPQWRLDSVTGLDGGAAPGEFMLAASEQQAQAGGSPYFNTRQGLPQTRGFPHGAHVHSSWDFAAAGTYCLAMTWEGIRSSGEVASVHRVLTFVVGGDSYDPKTAPTCEQAQASGVRFASGTPDVPAADGAAGRHVVEAPQIDGLWTAAFANLVPSLSDAGLSIDLVEGSRFNGGTRYALDNVVIQTRATALSSAPAAWGAGARYFLTDRSGKNAIDLDLSALDPGLSGLAGDMTWSLGQVRGPGEFDFSSDDGPLRLSTVPSRASNSGNVRPGTNVSGHWLFEEPGVYCLPFTFSGTRAGGGEVSVSATLAVAAGVPAATAQPGEQCVASEPPDDEEPGDPGDADPRADSGRTVLSEGHIDVLSTLDADRLAVTLHDDSVTPPAERAAGESTLFVSPDAVDQVGAGSAYAFLGQQGDPVWLLPQSQVDGLLWPGWNVRAGSQALSAQTRITWQLGEVAAPGKLELYQSDGFGAPSRLLSSSGPEHRSFSFSGHGHGNWAFTSDGAYCVPITATETETGRSTSFTLLFAVGDLKPEKVTEADCGKTADQIEGRGSEPGPEPMDLRPVVLDQGHIDLFELTYDKAGEQLDLRVKDDTRLYDLDAAYRAPETVTVAVDQAMAAFAFEEIPLGYEFLGPAGRETYLLDWSQQEGLPWPGWSTERLLDSLPDGVTIPDEQGSVTFGVTVEGPGDVFAFIPGDNGPENMYIDTTDDKPEVIETGPNIHYHTAWVFTEPGDYELTVTPSATTTAGDTLTGPAKSYHFHVGPRPALAQKVEAADFGASITGVPDSVTSNTEVELTLALDGDHPEVAGYQWYRWSHGYVRTPARPDPPRRSRSSPGTWSTPRCWTAPDAS